MVHSMIWVHEVGRGRLFSTGLGHDQKAWDNPALRKLVMRAPDYYDGDDDA